MVPNVETKDDPILVVRHVKVFYSGQSEESCDDPQHWLIAWHTVPCNLHFEVTNVNGREEPDVVADGYLKWDGCLNISFRRSIHFCGPEEKPLMGRLVEAIYKLGPEMKEWEGS